MPTILQPPTEKVLEKHKFKAPTDLLEHVKELHAAIVPTPILGPWVNCDDNTRGIKKIDIEMAGPNVMVHAWGACTPTPCDWKSVPGILYAESVIATPAISFTAQFKFGFAETLLVGRLDSGALIVETFDHFLDGSGRSDYYARYYMEREGKD
jgi:hypothetical protein